MKYILFLLLAGCATSDDLLRDAQQCGQGPECQEAWTKWNDYENWLLEKQQREDAFLRDWIALGHIFRVASPV